MTKNQVLSSGCHPLDLSAYLTPFFKNSPHIKKYSQFLTIIGLTNIHTKPRACVRIVFRQRSLDLVKQKDNSRNIQPPSQTRTTPKQFARTVGHRLVEHGLELDSNASADFNRFLAISVGVAARMATEAHESVESARAIQ